MESYNLPLDPITELILEKEYPAIKKEAKKLNCLSDVIIAYCSASSSVKVSSESKGCFNKKEDLERCLAGLNAAREVVDKFKTKNII